jgi:hypothetical protein
MRIINRKSWLTLVALLLVAPAAFATVSSTSHRQRSKHWNVPEGGSALVYVVGAGITCLGAMAVRSRSARPKQS